jgi:hypothetical protein
VKIIIKDPADPKGVFVLSEPFTVCGERDDLLSLASGIVDFFGGADPDDGAPKGRAEVDFPVRFPLGAPVHSDPPDPQPPAPEAA